MCTAWVAPNPTTTQSLKWRTRDSAVLGPGLLPVQCRGWGAPPPIPGPGPARHALYVCLLPACLPACMHACTRLGRRCAGLTHSPCSHLATPSTLHRAAAADAAAGPPAPAGMDERLVDIFRGVGALMSRYTVGKLPKAFKVIPTLKNWEEVLQLTEPQAWTPHAIFQATRIFVSSLNQRLVRRATGLEEGVARTTSRKRSRRRPGCVLRAGACRRPLWIALLLSRARTRAHTCSPHTHPRCSPNAFWRSCCCQPCDVTSGKTRNCISRCSRRCARPRTSQRRSTRVCCCRSAPMAPARCARPSSFPASCAGPPSPCCTLPPRCCASRVSGAWHGWGGGPFGGTMPRCRPGDCLDHRVGSSAPASHTRAHSQPVSLPVPNPLPPTPGTHRDGVQWYQQLLYPRAA